MSENSYSRCNTIETINHSTNIYFYDIISKDKILQHGMLVGAYL
jgi:hypothetical protein